jgi:hypothetical protein
MTTSIGAASTSAVIASTFMLFSAAHAAGNVFYVTNDGTDSAACGAQANACRSISQGIANATDGDTILVGAGKYGNISGSASYTGPGDEHPQFNVTATACIVCINKAVSIYSLHGPSVTVIEGTPVTNYTATVMIQHEGVNFGAPGRGFTITGGTYYGVLMAQEPDPYNDLGIHLKLNITIAGNVDLADQTGFSFQGRVFSDSVCPVDDCVPSAVITFAQNESIDNASAGFDMTEALFTGGSVVVQNNYAHGAGTGFLVPRGTGFQAGSVAESTRISLTGNVAVHNGLGFYAFAPGKMIGNTAASNTDGGFRVISGQAEFQNNTAVGNGGPGATVQFFSAGGTPAGILGFKSFTQNNFYGNDRNRPNLAIPVIDFPEVTVNPGPSAHCGVLNMGVLGENSTQVANPPIPAPLNANGNFWGTTHGPAPTGASDAIGGACDQNGGKTTVTSYAAAGFAITTH